MISIQELTSVQRAFLESYFRSIFDGENDELVDADETSYVSELSKTEFTEGDIVSGNLVKVAKNLLVKGCLADVHSEKLGSGYTLTVDFNEQTARLIYQLTQAAKEEGRFRELSGFTAQAPKM